jgi:hypothetical protein
MRMGWVMGIRGMSDRFFARDTPLRVAGKRVSRLQLYLMFS